MSKIVEFFDKLEEMLKGKKRSILEKGMGYFTRKKIVGAFTFVEMELVCLIIWITGADADLLVDYCFMIPLMIIGYIPAQICIHYLNKRIKAQETEELAEDLEDDIERISSIALIVAIILFFILGLIYVYC